MLRVMKSTGRVTDTRANDGKKGKKGRIELNLIRQDDGDFVLRFEEFGNYGKTRWHADVLMTEDDVNDMNLNAQNFLASKDSMSLSVFKASEAEEAKQPKQETKQQQQSSSKDSSKNEVSNESKESKKGFQKINSKPSEVSNNNQEQDSKEEVASVAGS